jgi:hypothetical protein
MAKTYRILALGDSVMWGQGLHEADKFAQLIRDHIERMGRFEQVELLSLAHAGARIDLPQHGGPCTRDSSFLYGEVPRFLPNLYTQLAIAKGKDGYDTCLEARSWDPPFWGRSKRQMAKQFLAYADAPPDLILLAAGLGDFASEQIVLPWSLEGGDEVLTRIVTAAEHGDEATAGSSEGVAWMTDKDFKELVDRRFTARMRTLLPEVGRMFPQTPVVVMGTYPLFTPGSLRKETVALDPRWAVLLGHGTEERLFRAALHCAQAAERERFWNQTVAQSRLWYEFGNERLAAAIEETNQTVGERFFLARPEFGPDHGMLASQSLLFGLTPAVDALLAKLPELLGPPDRRPRVLAPPESVTTGLGYAVGLALGMSLATDHETVARTWAAMDFYVASFTGQSDRFATFVNGLMAGAASSGYPNVRGAQVHAQAIQGLLQAHAKSFGLGGA